MNPITRLYHKRLAPEALADRYLAKSDEKKVELVREWYYDECFALLRALVDELYHRGRALEARDIQREVDALRIKLRVPDRLWQSI